MGKLGLLSKFNSIPKKTRIAIFGTTLAIGNILTVASLSLAWFFQYSAASSQVKTFSGDLGVTIEKVSAYKYIYPYHSDSPEFINYEGVGMVKSYVVEDASISAPAVLSDSVTFALTAVTNKDLAGNPGAASSSTIYYDNNRGFNYYLVGNSVFNGVENNEWSTSIAVVSPSNIAPTQSAEIADKYSVLIKSVTVSVGSEFIFFDATTIDEEQPTKCSYFTYNTQTENARFVVENGHLKCRKSGIYDFRYRLDNSGNLFLDINLISTGDSTIMASNLVDPTMMSIDYYGGSIELPPDHPEPFEDINDYLPYGIREQKTMVLLDVLVSYQNKNDIEAGLKIVRSATALEPSIYSYGGYSTTNDYTYLGYKNDRQQNPLYASDFYSFYTEVKTSEHAYADPTTAWNAFSTRTTAYEIDDVPQYDKFINDVESDYEPYLICRTNGDSTLIPGSNTDNFYHIYIAVDYDHEHMRFFLDQDRLGTTFILARDFSFYFTAEQIVEENSSSSSSSSSSEGGESN